MRKKTEIKASWKTPTPLAELSKPVCTCTCAPLHYRGSIFVLGFDLFSCPGWTHQGLSPMGIKGQAHKFSLGKLLECQQEGSTPHDGTLSLFLLLRGKTEANKKSAICLLERHWDLESHSVWGLIIVTHLSSTPQAHHSAYMISFHVENISRRNAVSFFHAKETEGHVVKLGLEPGNLHA